MCLEQRMRGQTKRGGLLKSKHATVLNKLVRKMETFPT